MCVTEEERKESSHSFPSSSSSSSPTLFLFVFLFSLFLSSFLPLYFVYLLQIFNVSICENEEYKTSLNSLYLR